MGARIADRWRLTLPLLLPALGGLAYLYAFGAPTRLIAVNAGALALALAWVWIGRIGSAPAPRFGIAVALAVALFVPQLTGPDLGGVTRWIPAGPVALHSGALLLPLLVVLAASEARWGPLLLAAATAGLAFQPDAASLLAVGLASAVLAATARSLPFGLVAAAAFAAALLTLHAGSLEPQLYTEGVLAHVAGHSLPAATALGLLLLAAPIFVLATPTPRPETFALAAVMFGLGVAATIAPFPFPLIGYGASPILGFGLALGALGRLSPAPESR